MKIQYCLFFPLVVLSGGGGSPGLPAASGGPPGEASEGAEGGKGRGGGPFGFSGRRYQCLQRALPKGPGGPESEREAATIR